VTELGRNLITMGLKLKNLVVIPELARAMAARTIRPHLQATLPHLGASTGAWPRRRIELRDCAKGRLDLLKTPWAANFSVEVDIGLELGLMHGQGLLRAWRGSRLRSPVGQRLPLGPRIDR
jgi:hypothetical protein